MPARSSRCSQSSAAIAFAIGVGLANVCYSVGPVAELLLCPRNAKAFRQRAYTLGRVLSAALPWIVPMNAWSEFIAVKLRG